MKKNAFYLTMMLTTLGCSELNSGEKIEQAVIPTWDSKKTIPVDRCYVLCDFSSSLSAKSRQAILTKALKIFESAALRCKLAVYDINALQFNAPFFEFEELMKNARKRSQRDKLLQHAIVQSDTLSKRIQRYFTATPSRNTCIINTLDVLARSLATLPPPHKDEQISIIILSDMLEDCSFGKGNIAIERDGIERAKKNLARIHKPGFTFAKFKNLKVTLTACSDRTNMSARDLNEFWKLVLKKFDYDFEGPITELLPHWVIAN